LASLREAGACVAFLTNNSSRTPEQVVDKLRAIGIEARRDEVVTSALATADVLRERGGTAYVIGQDGIRLALVEAGIVLADEEVDRVDHVVVGVDVDVTYRKL